MSQNITEIKQSLLNCEEVDSPFELIKGNTVKYITLQGEEEFFFEGGSYQSMGNNKIIIKEKGKRKIVPLTHIDKGGDILYKTRLFTETRACTSTDEEKLGKIILNQQHIIDTMTEQLKKLTNDKLVIQERNKKLEDFIRTNLQ